MNRADHQLRLHPGLLQFKGCENILHLRAVACGKALQILENVFEEVQLLAKHQ